jgi:hydrogenase maturation protein HypF
MSRAALRLTVRGQVQGVGFRPFVFRLAAQCRLCGGVWNSAVGVVVEAEGEADDLADFRERLVAEAPPAARIDGLEIEPAPVTGREEFAIQDSEPPASPRVRLPRDLATCAECFREVFAPGNRRRGYPFTNCTSCGPRFSILEVMPYDRAATSMRRFTLCPACTHEYGNPADRRFHAEPNACPVCGPRVALWDRDGRTIAGADEAIPAAVSMLRAGRILALKGLGGFQLLARADDAAVVVTLRRRKHRPTKPLAVMVAVTPDGLDGTERELLESAANPIVLVDRARISHPVVEGVAPRVGTLGLLLPTTPLHHLLLDALGLPVVATSGNGSGEPIATDECDALCRLGGIADAFLVHDRPIVRGLDDSVVRVIAGRPVVLRLARGYAPLPLPALESLGDGVPAILATGGHQKVALALWSGSQAILAQHLGDLDHPDTRAGFLAATRDLARLYQCQPAVIAHDGHPDYFTTTWAQGEPVRTLAVQHHHAHAAAAMAEFGLLEREVLAFTWDGTGYGEDGTIWGGEALRVGRGGYQRVASLRLFTLPGGEAAIRHPVRTAFGLLWGLLGEDVVRDPALLGRLGLVSRQADVLAGMIARGVNAPQTSSVGRLFDAVAALTVGAYEVSYEGEAALALEAVADPGESGAYPLPRGDWRPMLVALLDDLARGVAAGVVAARFHNGLAEWAAAVAREQPLPDIVLAGGCFQNRLLCERTADRLQGLGRRVHTPGLVPPGDGGLSVGQLAVALQLARR